MIVLFPLIAEVVLEEQDPPYVIVPASSEEKVYSGVVSVVGVVTAVTSAITGAVVSLDVLLLHEIIVRLKRRRERMMRMCFTWFPIGGLGKPNIYQNLGGFTRNWEDCGGVSDSVKN